MSYNINIFVIESKDKFCVVGKYNFDEIGTRITIDKSC